MPASRPTSGIDAQLHRHAWSETGRKRLPRIHHDAHADPLRNLDEVAGGIVGLENGELRLGRGRQPLNMTVKPRAVEGVDGEAGLLAGSHMSRLCLLEISDHPFIARHQ